MKNTFRRPKAVWPNPEDSIGGEFLDWRLEGLRCFEAIGPACDAYVDVILPAIDKLLARNKEELEREETKFMSVGYGMFMIGIEPSKAKPTIIIVSLNKD
jgi:hypothetical protein